MRISKLASQVAMDLFWRLNIRTYQKKLRIKTIISGKNTHNTNFFAIFIFFSKTEIPLFTRTWLEALSRNRVNLVIVVNSNSSDSVLNELTSLSHTVIIRHNIGRDFGAYKDALIYLKKYIEGIDTIILGNDSVYYCGKDLDKLISSFIECPDLCGITDNHDTRYHIQSYLLSFGKDLLRQDVFWQFWKSYLPIGTRHWAIMKGEIAFSQKMIQAGVKIKVLFKTADLRRLLENETDANIGSLLEYLPLNVRYLFKNETTGQIFGDRSSIIQRILSVIDEAHTTHRGQFIFLKYLDFPILKRDIFYRKLFDIETIKRILLENNVATTDEILDDLVKRGTIDQLNWLKRKKIKLGV